MKKKKASIIDNEEKVLKYLLNKERNPDNTMILGFGKYGDVKGISPEEFIQTLFALKDMRYIDLDFRGYPGTTTPCIIKIKEAGLTYFEDQDIMEDEDKKASRHDYLVEHSGAIIGSIAAAVLGFIVGRLTG